MLDEVVSDGEVHLTVTDQQVQDVHQLGHRVTLLHDDLLSPVGQHALETTRKYKIILGLIKL